MAYVVPPTFTPGAILTAAQMTILGNDILAGGPIYATEAARDAAITSPFEGQRAYITGSSTTAPTGGTIYVPTGIQTIYNGAAWVCVTPFGAFTSNQGTYNTEAFSPTLTGTPGTNPSATVATGTTALIDISAILTASALMTMRMDVAVSGATTLAAGTVSAQGIFRQTGSTALGVSCQSSFIISGLTAGNNTFTINYLSNNSCTFANRRITARGIA